MIKYLVLESYDNEETWDDWYGYDDKFIGIADEEEEAKDLVSLRVSEMSFKEEGVLSEVEESGNSTFFKWYKRWGGRLTEEVRLIVF